MAAEIPWWFTCARSISNARQGSPDPGFTRRKLALKVTAQASSHSTASAPIPAGEFFALPEGARMPPRVAILNHGASHELWLMVLELGEPANQRVSESASCPAATLYLYTVTLYTDGTPVLSLIICSFVIPPTCLACASA